MTGREQAGRVAVSLLLAAGAAGCVFGSTQAGVSPGGVVVGSDRTGWATKRVVEKQAPETLLAEDGTICRVSPDRFKDTATGALVQCNWQ